jgi:ABC-type transporter Mla maintaining outer membrane lipid asymmetry ATPase subunit MlaF
VTGPSLAVRYARKTAQHEVKVSAPAGSVTRLHVPDDQAKACLVTALLKARCEPGEELELFGEPAARLRARSREVLRGRVGAVSPVVGLITNLNAWENISLPAAYHGAPPLAEVAELSHQVLAGFGVEPDRFFPRLPDEMGTLERKIAAFIRLLVRPPELMVFDALEDGLSHADCACAGRFEALYRARQPAGTVLYVDTREDS